MRNEHPSSMLRSIPPEIRNMSQELLAVRYYQLLTGQTKGGQVEQRRSYVRGRLSGLAAASIGWLLLIAMAVWNLSP